MLSFVKALWNSKAPACTQVAGPRLVLSLSAFEVPQKFHPTNVGSYKCSNASPDLFEMRFFPSFLTGFPPAVIDAGKGMSAESRRAWMEEKSLILKQTYW